MGTRVNTIPVRVNVYTAEHLISGFVHTKPGGYRDRVSDILNDPGIRFLVLTDAVFRPLEGKEGVAKRCETLLLNLDAIKMLIPFEDDPARKTCDGMGPAPGAGAGGDWAR